MEDHYGIRLRLEDATLITKHYTGILPSNDLEAILKSLSAIYQLEVVREDQQVTLY